MIDNDGPLTISLCIVIIRIPSCAAYDRLPYRRVRCQRSGGSAAWETDINQGRPVFSSPFFAAVTCETCSLLCPLVFACSVSGLIAALRASDGMVLGTKTLPGAVFSSPVVVGRRLVVGCRDNHAYAIEIFVRCSRC